MKVKRSASREAVEGQPKSKVARVEAKVDEVDEHGDVRMREAKVRRIVFVILLSC
jgi:hypothetical protein